MTGTWGWVKSTSSLDDKQERCPELQTLHLTAFVFNGQDLVPVNTEIQSQHQAQWCFLCAKEQRRGEREVWGQAGNHFMMGNWRQHSLNDRKSNDLICCSDGSQHDIWKRKLSLVVNVESFFPVLHSRLKSLC